MNFSISISAHPRLRTLLRSRGRRAAAPDQRPFHRHRPAALGHARMHGKQDHQDAAPRPTGRGRRALHADVFVLPGVRPGAHGDSHGTQLRDQPHHHQRGNRNRTDLPDLQDVRPDPDQAWLEGRVLWEMAQPISLCARLPERGAMGNWPPPSGHGQARNCQRVARIFENTSTSTRRRRAPCSRANSSRIMYGPSALALTA